MSKKVDADLYDFLMNNECHLFRDDFHSGIDAWVSVSFWKLEEFVEMIGDCHFDECGLKVTMKKDYIGVELRDIIELMGDELESYKKCFDEDEWDSYFSKR